MSCRSNAAAHSLQAMPRSRQPQSLAYLGGNKVTYSYKNDDVTSVSVTINGVTQVVVNNAKRLLIGPVKKWTYGNGLVRWEAWSEECLTVS